MYFLNFIFSFHMPWQLMISKSTTLTLIEAHNITLWAAKNLNHFCSFDDGSYLTWLTKMEPTFPLLQWLRVINQVLDIIAQHGSMEANCIYPYQVSWDDIFGHSLECWISSDQIIYQVSLWCRNLGQKGNQTIVELTLWFSRQSQANCLCCEWKQVCESLTFIHI